MNRYFFHRRPLVVRLGAWFHLTTAVYDGEGECGLYVRVGPWSFVWAAGLGRDIK